MKLYFVICGVLAACAVSMAVEPSPLIAVFHPSDVAPQQVGEHTRQKRGLLLGAGAGLIGAAALGAGAIGAVGLGAGLIGAKAGFVGGALAGGALSHGRSYGGWGYGGGYGGYGGYGHGYYGGGYGGGYYGVLGYRTYYPTTTYVVSDPWC